MGADKGGAAGAAACGWGSVWSRPFIPPPWLRASLEPLSWGPPLSLQSWFEDKAATSSVPEGNSGGRVRRASGGRGGKWRKARRSGVPREAFQPGDLAFPQISAPARAPRPLFSPSGNTPVKVGQPPVRPRVGWGRARGDPEDRDVRVLGSPLPARPGPPAPQEAPRRARIRSPNWASAPAVLRTRFNDCTCVRGLGRWRERW